MANISTGYYVPPSVGRTWYGNVIPLPFILSPRLQPLVNLLCFLPNSCFQNWRGTRDIQHHELGEDPVDATCKSDMIFQVQRRELKGFEIMLKDRNISNGRECRAVYLYFEIFEIVELDGSTPDICKQG